MKTSGWIGQTGITSWSFALLLSCCIGCAPWHEKQLTQSIQPPASFRTVPIGLCEDYPEESRSLTNAQRDLEVLATNDLRVLRIAFGWDAMEPEPGKYDWSFWDDFVRTAVDDHHIRLVPYVCYTPRWASSSQGEDFWQQPPKDNAQFAAFVKQLVSRYKDRIHSWEIWNEPDNSAYWRGTTKQFAELLAAGSRAVHEAEPTAQVVMGGLAWNLNFLEEVINTPAAITNVNVINLHNYYETWSSDPVENLSDYIGRAHDLLRQHGQQQPIWLAEIGYSSFRKGAEVSGQYQAWFQHEHTLEAQADTLFRMLTVSLASRNVSLVAWYRVNDLPSTQEVIGDVNNRHLGVLDEHGKAKPALRSLRFFQSLFANGFHLIDDQVRMTKHIGSPVQAHAFQLANGQIVVIAWLKNYVPGSRNNIATGNVIDSRRETISLSFPFSIRRAEQFNAFGDRINSVSVSHHDSVSEIRTLELRGDAVSVLLLR